MKAAYIDEFSNYDSITLKDVPIPEPPPGSVLVQMKTAAMNVGDLMYVNGQYIFQVPLPAILGFEGSGIVVKGDEELIGKRVNAYCTGGAYAEYCVFDRSMVIQLEDSTTFAQAANIIRNPMTVATMIDKIQQGNHLAVLVNAPASALGKMLVRWCAKINVPTICLIRREEQAEAARAAGCQYIFNTTEEGWKSQVKPLCQELKVTAAFDAVSGTATGDMIELVEDGGVVYTYGALSGEPCILSPIELVARKKRLEGIYVFAWFKPKTQAEKDEVGRQVQSMINDVCKTDIAREVPFDDLPNGFRTYAGQKTNAKQIVRISPD